MTRTLVAAAAIAALVAVLIIFGGGGSTTLPAPVPVHYGCGQQYARVPGGANVTTRCPVWTVRP